MNSSQIALIASLVPILVAGLTLTSAQLRVLRRRPPHRIAYVVAWIACALFLAAFRTLTDYVVGSASVAGALRHLGVAAAFSSAALVAAHALARPQFLRLLSMHLGVLLLLHVLFER